MAVDPLLGIPFSPSTAQSKVDIQNCEDEQIRIPGSIQPHGFLLLLDDRLERIVAASESTEEFLEVPLTLILGALVEVVLEREVLGALKAQANSNEILGSQAYLGAFQMRGRLYSVITHRVGNERILEFERLEQLISSELTNQVFTNFVSKLNKLRDEKELCQALTDQVKSLTGFNRVLLYRFDEYGHGTVLCEETDSVLPSYLDLRFPASDIPRQARALYLQNTVRIIPDAMYLASPLRAINQRPIATLDLSMSILRSVSPFHLEYMRNMGTTSSMSISIVSEDKLWGLVSGHHAEPRMVPYLVRSVCDLLTKLVCAQLTSFRSATNLKKIVHFHAVQRRMLMHMAAENNHVAAIAEQMRDLIEITDANGAALVIDGQFKVFGQTPAEEDIHKLAAWMDGMPDLEVFESRHLGKHIEWAEAFSEVASGLLAVRISYIRQGYIMWFRPEVVRTVNWAGEPKKLDHSDKGLNPRQSFETWKELVRGRSNPWTEMEIESATDFRGAVMTISLKRAEEAVQLGEARFLQLTNALPHPVWTSDDEGRLTYVNLKWLDQGLGNMGRWYEEDRLALEDRDRTEDLWKISVARGMSFDIEVRFRSPAETVERWNLVRAIPYLQADGSRAGWAGTCTDLTDRRQRETAIRMSEKLALSGRMTSVIAHEINNPLEAIINLLYLLGGRVKGDDVATDYIGSAEAELQRISGLTKQTLRWSKENVQKAEYGTAGELFRDVLQLFAGKIRNRQVNVTIKGGEDFRFYGTVGQLSQVVANLLSNAIQAVAVGGRIWLGATSSGETMQIVIRDNGCGMSQETLRNLFQPFYSTKGDLGNGLGLYISREIVERHQGSITAESELDIGTTMRISLPTRKPLDE
ncbi:ATP-binding protein [Tunturiibacter empetritectus]|uniref:histidine kinase n=1 Tax=Tunturiibacter lichenicola TaxID=2051959 RepID=A0A852VN29_9BACT|nr:ATP-binding protein [Edaphobacter lichenicola]NYF91475.1 light-regulated signal transduction histidine kinase (bacteriophytochrome) [Edaphobacter lichenicola]